MHTRTGAGIHASKRNVADSKHTTAAPPLLPPNLRVDYFAATGDVAIVAVGSEHRAPNAPGAGDARSASFSSSASTASSTSSSAAAAAAAAAAATATADSSHQQQHHHHHRRHRHHNFVGTSSSSSQQQQQQPNPAAGSSINVTPNPMDTPVCAQPRATIVVQQVRTDARYSLLYYIYKRDRSR